MKKCKATIVFGDDYGDNPSTFHCQLEAGHGGSHKETGDMGYGAIKRPYIPTWEGSEEELERAFKEKTKGEALQNTLK